MKLYYTELHIISSLQLLSFFVVSIERVGLRIKLFNIPMLVDIKHMALYYNSSKTKTYFTDFKSCSNTVRPQYNEHGFNELLDKQGKSKYVYIFVDASI